MTAPESKDEAKKPAIELSLTDHFIQVLKAALEFNTQIIEIATEVVAMDASGHNKTLVRRVHEKMNEANRGYSRQVDETNRRIVEQFLPSIQKEDEKAE